MPKIDDMNSNNKGYGLWAIEIDSWLQDSKDVISTWSTEKEADVYRRNHMIHPNKYIVKEIK